MFPCLGMLARQVLSVPVSTVAVEREFSAGGNILTDYRSCLNAESLEILSFQCIRIALHFLRPAVLARFFGLRFLNSLRVALHFLRAVVLASVLFIFFCFVGNWTSWRPANTHEYEEVGEHNEAVSKIWAIAKKQIEQGVAIDVRSRMIGKKGRKRTVMDAQAIADTPLRKRTNVRSLAAAIGKPKSTVHEWIKKETVQAQRKSKNRAKGVFEVKPITSVTKQVTKDMLIKQVIPCIQEKWPAQLSKDIHIQQDNARPHIQGLDSDFMAAANTNGFHITLNNQPPNSPDLNVLDLGFFRAIQSLKEQCAPTSVPELLEAVQRAYNALNPETLNKVWLTYQQVLTKVMEHEGNNNYRLPHMGKDRLAREVNLPKSLSIDLDLIQKTARLVGQQNGGRNEGMVEFNTEEGDDYQSLELN
ncbi:unnamed protein product [Cuscuta campestris]|uniref:HAT C-terminal dimerisation domain-containing protein n=1 Tax=Cuscuta campestris TaxID=132261 RepID=A0A484LL40_9ASTE|nr:unnamed protein product [Cuscuta campestris]